VYPCARRSLRFCLLIAGVALIAGCGSAHRVSTPPTTKTQPETPKPSGPFAHPRSSPHLARGSDPSVLPGDILIADRSNSRLLVVDPQGRIVWQFGNAHRLPLPDDAFFSPDGRKIVATEEDVNAISVIDIATRRIVYRVATGLSHPDDALMVPGGDIVSADIKNCRLIELRPPSRTPIVALGSALRGCVHAPPDAWGSPNGAFPRTGGGWIVTEINGDWVDALSPSGRILWEMHPPGMYYPSDTNEIRPGLYLTVAYESPGILEKFTRSGHHVWRYVPRRGDPQLDHPSLALPLPNGDVLLNDDYNDRVIVIDPRTNRVVWQYGHTNVPGTAPGFLNRPDGVDLVPPFSLMAGRHGTMPLR
jgi:DNA-binding beta-propeller fold protein YncE